MFIVISDNLNILKADIIENDISVKEIKSKIQSQPKINWYSLGTFQKHFLSVNLHFITAIDDINKVIFSIFLIDNGLVESLIKNIKLLDLLIIDVKI